MNSFIFLSLIGGFGISIITAILGNFMIWRRISYLGDAIGHSSLLGIAIGILFNEVNIYWIFLVCILFAITLVFLKKIYTFTFESLIVFNVQLFLSLSLIILGWLYIGNGNATLSYIFGDLLLLTIQDIVLIFILMIVIIIYIVVFWKSLVLLSINEELSYSENVKVLLNNILFMILTAGSIAVLVKFVGVFLIPSLLIIPALISNYTSKSPYKSFIISASVTYFAIIIGILSSFIIDISPTPLITIITIFEFIIVILIKNILNLIKQQ